MAASRRRAGLGAAAAALAVVALAGCWGTGGDGGGEGGGGQDPEPDGSATPNAYQAVDTPQMAFRFKVTPAERLSFTPAPSPSAARQCNGGADQSATLERGKDRIASFQVFAKSCEPTRDNDKPGNGYHGVYRSPEDIPADLRGSAERVPTAIGSALVFDQRYYECTNSCRTWTEPVAVIDLTHPADASHPALVVISPQGRLGHAELAALIKDRFAAPGR
ncbi:hypothetical protein [Wenjunlia tyrosinilytica]|nr:hypothetical protein [Wenjunlia tyrosinilytica]